MTQSLKTRKCSRLPCALRWSCPTCEKKNRPTCSLSWTRWTAPRHHAQAIKMRQMSEAKTGGERLAKDALVSIMKEEKPNQKEQFKIPKEKISRFFAPGTPARKNRGHHCQGAGTLPQTPAQFREIAHSQGGSAPHLQGNGSLYKYPSPHLTSKQPKQPKKRRYLGFWMYIESSGLFFPQADIGLRGKPGGPLFFRQ